VSHAAKRQTKHLSSMHSPTMKKRRKLSNTKTPFTWDAWFRLQNQKYVNHGQLDRSSSDNTCPDWWAWQTSQTWNSCPCLGAWYTHNLPTCQSYSISTRFHFTIFILTHTLLTHVLTRVLDSFVLQVSLFVLLIKVTLSLICKI